MKKKIAIVLFLLISTATQGQIYNPVKWSYAAKKVSSVEAVLYLKATIDASWHIYSLNQKSGGPLKTSFDFQISKDYALAGKTTEPMPISKFDDTFGIQVDSFDSEVVFQQKIKLKKSVTVVKGKISYMACTDERCTPPLEKEFSIPVK